MFSAETMAGVVAQLARRLSAFCDAELGSAMYTKDALPGVPGTVQGFVRHREVANEWMTDLGAAVYPEYA